jgi:predicted nucleotidyltransferase
MARSTQEVDLASLLDRVVKRIVQVADPERIVLFGSAARGELGPDSDIDLLVVKDGVFRRRSVASDIYRSLSGVGYPVDVVVVHVDDVRAFRHSVGSIIEPALREGRVVYER